MAAPAPTPPPAAPDDSAVGLPVLRTWRGVYCLVLAAFALWIFALTLLPRLCS